MNELFSAFPLFSGGEKKGERTRFSSIREAAEFYGGFRRFTTTGHHGALASADVTETDEDALFPAQTVARAEEKARKAYGVKKARLLAGGSSMGIKAAILAADTDLIAPRFSHRSVFEGATLARRKVFTFDTVEQSGLPSPPSVADYERAIDENGSAGAVLVTSPDYFGRVAPVHEIRELCCRRGLIMIADCAHGAHFAFRPDLFPAGAERVADFAVMSAHKTLRCLTSGAIGTVNDEKFFGRYDEALTLLGTSSPSYLILASIEDAIGYEREHAGEYDRIVAAADDLRREVRCFPADDPLRITVDAGEYGMTGEQLYYALFRRGVLAEAFLGRRVVFIVTLSDGADAVEALKKDIVSAIKERA